MANPFLKWPGGKRWAVDQIAPFVLDSLTQTYYEPFLGGGALFFSLLPQRAVLSDINEELINTYKTVKLNYKSLITRVSHMPVNKDAYYRIRSERSSDVFRKASCFLYLNRTAFGGMYRLNQNGEFNVPFGGGQRTPSILWNAKLLENAAIGLEKAQIMVSDFEPMIDKAGEGDVVFCDPTYTVTHDKNAFVRYNEKNFSWEDQIRLANAAFRAVDRGATVVISNAHHKSLKGLYPGVLTKTLKRQSLLSTDVNKRRPVAEYLFVIRPS